MTNEPGTLPSPLPIRLWRRAAPMAGPAAIVVAVAVVLHDYVLGRTATQALDPLGFFLPSHCFLGTHLAGGDIPLWNRHVMAGLPFAADPQSGWMNLSAMLLYTALPCHVAFGWYVVLNPVLAGLGLYGFLRLEGLSRAAAATGGLALALPLAGSSVAPGSLPFAATLAWTAVMLAGGSGYRRATTWPSRLLWLLGVSVAWGQLATAHLSIGLLVGSAALAVSLGAGLVADVRAGRRTVGDAAIAVALLGIALPLVNAAVLLPRVLYLPRTTLGLGYARLETLTAELTGGAGTSGGFGQGLPLRRPVALALAPGYYFGAALALVFLPFASRARRGLGLAFGAYGALSFTLASGPVVRALAPAGGSWLGGLYLHLPSRFLFGLIVALAVLAAVGLDAVREGPARRWWAVPVALPMITWVVLPLWWSGWAALLPAAGVALGSALVIVAAGRPRWAVVIPAVVAIQLTVAGAVGHGPAATDTGAEADAGAGRFLPLWPPATADARLSEFLRPGPIARALEGGGRGRYVSIDPPRSLPSGYPGQLPGLWGLLASQQSMVFGLEEAQGYNPAQSPRFWSFVRGSDPKEIGYARAWFLNPSPVALDLLQVEWVVASDRRWVPAADATLEAREGIWRLYRIPGSPPRASVLSSWTPARGPDEALRLITDPAFDPSSTVILEPPAVGTPAGTAATGQARFRWLGTESARVDVEATAPAVVLIRNSFDPNWQATVDGRPTGVLAADLFLQAVAVPAGRHTIVLRYEDPSVGWGLWVSAAAAAAILAAAGAARGRASTRDQLTPASRPLPWRGR